MKKIILALSFIACFSLGFWLVFKPSGIIKKEISLTAEEKALFSRMWEILYFDANFGYTLVGTKPVSIQNWSKDLLRIAPSRFAFYIDGRTREFWEHFAKTHPSEHYALLFFDYTLPETSKSPQQKFGEVVLINKAQVRQCFEKHKPLFTQFLAFADFCPETIVSQVLQSGNHELIGIILGFGAHNSKYFQRAYDLEAYFRKASYFPNRINEQDWAFLQSFPQGSFVNEISLSPKEAVVELQAYLSNEFESLDAIVAENPLSPISLPCFRADKKHPETSALIDKYQKEQKQVIEFGLSKPLLDSILHIYFNGV